MNFDNLGFNYIDTNCHYIMQFKDGKWQKGKIERKSSIELSHNAAVFHYGQACFEGLKAYRTHKNDIVIFRPDENAKRLNTSAHRLMMPQIPEETFLQAIKQLVQENTDFIPPSTSTASLYIRPVFFASGTNFLVQPSDEYIFCVFCSPVGGYFSEGLNLSSLVTTQYDRAAPVGTGKYKAGGNYAGGMLPNYEAKKAGFSECLYLDAKTHTYIEEVGAANFFGITANNEFITPMSPSILPGITRKSLMHIAEHYLGMKVIEEPIAINDVGKFTECGACGTAAIISPIGKIKHKDNVYNFGTKVGDKTQQLYDLLRKIQRDEIEVPEGWLFKI